MSWMISHEMKCLFSMQPFRYCIKFTLVDARIKVSTNIYIDLRIQNWKKSPIHREHIRDISF
uniref:Uncharacterized protein n=1 Tax=Lepeophtheirus salmonis TaxID=72036 RepID=A0A0K2TQ59_LEPSM